MPSCVVKSCKNYSKSHKKSHGITLHSSPSPAAAAAQPAAPPGAAPPGAAGEPRACTSPGGRVYVGFRPMELWDDEEEPSEPGFYPDQPAAERRDEMSARRHSPSALERPGSLAVQAPAEPANVPAAGMPSGGGSTARCAAGNITYAQCAAGVPPSRAAGALSAAGTPSGSGDRRDSQLTNKGTPTPAAAAAAPAEPAADPAADPVETRASRPVETRASRPVERRYGPAVVRPEVSPGGTIYIGFTPPHILMLEDEEDSGPEPDDATYEYYEFDPDQPASERRDDMRMRGPYY